MSNGGLSASIRKFIEMMKNNKLYLYNYTDNIEYYKDRIYNNI